MATARVKAASARATARRLFGNMAVMVERCCWVLAGGDVWSREVAVMMGIGRISVNGILTVIGMLWEIQWYDRAFVMGDW